VETYYVLPAFLERANANPVGIPYLQNPQTIRCISENQFHTSDEGYYGRYDLGANIKLIGN
jgi:hypothetical protein